MEFQGKLKKSYKEFNDPVPKNLLEKLDRKERDIFFDSSCFTENQIKTHKYYFEEIDREDILSSMVNSNHILISSPTGSGKSTLIKGMIKFAKEKSNPIIKIVDIKGEDWSSVVEEKEVVYPEEDCPEVEIEKVVEDVFDIFKERKQSKETERPVWLIIDEYNSVIELMKASNGKYKSFTSYIFKLLTMGRSYNIHLCLAAHTHTVESLGLSKGTRNNFSILCLSSSQWRYKNITDFLSDTSVLPEEDRVEGKERLKSLRERGNRLIIGSSIDLMELPDLTTYIYINEERNNTSNEKEKEFKEPEVKEKGDNKEKMDQLKLSPSRIVRNVIEFLLENGYNKEEISSILMKGKPP